MVLPITRDQKGAAQNSKIPFYNLYNIGANSGILANLF